MMESYGRSLRTTELRLWRSIFGMASDRSWAPTASFEVPKQFRDTTSVAMPEIPSKLAAGPSECTRPHAPKQGGGALALSDDGSSASSMTWGNKADGLCEVDIADHYSRMG